jgi:hypothetical protein
MKLVVLFLLMFGIVLILLDEIVNRQPPRVEYKYIPRDLDMYLREIPFAVYDHSKIFEDAMALRST